MGQHMNAKDAPCQGPNSTAEQTECFSVASHNADTEMNRMYDRVRKVLSPEEEEKLRVAQQLWLQFREANCAAERELYRGGTAAFAVHSACLEADTRQRTAELHTMYDWRLIKWGLDN